MSDSYLVKAYDNGEASIIGIFDKLYKREPRRNGCCCTMSVVADGIDEAKEKAKMIAKMKEGEIT